MESNPIIRLVQEITQKLDTYGCARSALPFILHSCKATIHRAQTSDSVLAEHLDMPPVENTSLLSFLYQTAPPTAARN